MECEICFLAFDSTIRRPKFLLCGHSACLACLERITSKRCPVCRVEFTGPPKKLPDNFSLLRPPETIQRQPKMWCSCCETVAEAKCLDNHTLKSVYAVLKSEMAQLQSREVKQVKKLTEAFSQADVDSAECTAEKALQVLRLARQPGTSFQFTVRGSGGGEALKANWTNAPAAPGADSEAVEAVMAGLLGLALAKKGCLQVDKQKAKGNAAQGVGAGKGQSGAAAVIQELKVDEKPTERRRKEILQTVRQHRVLSLTKLDCSVDAAWSVQLLQLIAPYIEKLSLEMVLSEQLKIVHAMPKLKWLKVYGDVKKKTYTSVDSLPTRLPGLRLLMVAYLSLETTLSLVHAHSKTLEVLWLLVSTTNGEGTWTKRYPDLSMRLGLCGFSKLRQLVLVRPQTHHDIGCRLQLEALRCTLPRIQVQCEACDNVPCPL